MSQQLQIKSLSPLIFEIRLCLLADNTVESESSAGIQIDKKCTINIVEVAFVKLINIYTGESLGPALDLRSCTCSVDKSCFIECYYQKAGSYYIDNCECTSFSSVSLLKSGFLGNTRCIHPSFFLGSTINKYQDYNISYSAREIVYFNSYVKIAKVRFVTIGDTYADLPFHVYTTNENNEFADSVVVRALKNDYFAKGVSSKLLILTNCVFSETVPSKAIGDETTVFKGCSFSLTEQEFNTLKGAADVSGSSFITGSVVRFPLVGRCPNMNRRSSKVRTGIKCVLWFAFIPLLVNSRFC